MYLRAFSKAYRSNCRVKTFINFTTRHYKCNVDSSVAIIKMLTFGETYRCNYTKMLGKLRILSELVKMHTMHCT